MKLKQKFKDQNLYKTTSKYEQDFRHSNYLRGNFEHYGIGKFPVSAIEQKSMR